MAPLEGGLVTTAYAKQGSDFAQACEAAGFLVRSAAVLHVGYAERRTKYSLRFMFSPFYEYSNLE